MSVSSPRRSTRPPESSSGTSPRRSATSGWSMPPMRSMRPATAGSPSARPPRPDPILQNLGCGVVVRGVQGSAGSGTSPRHFPIARPRGLVLAQVSLVVPAGTGPTVIAVDGELDFATVPALLQRLNSASGDVELDCSRLTFLDCHGLDALIGAHRGCEARGNRLTVKSLSGVCLRVVRMARADSLLHLVWPHTDDSEFDDPDRRPELAIVPNTPKHVFEAGLERAREIIAKENGLATFVTLRPDGAAQATVVNAGVLAHPV